MSYNTILIYGLGLIGGSIAGRIRETHPNTRILGISRRQSSIDFALDQGLIDAGATTLSALETTIDLAFICTPISLTPTHIAQVSAHVPGPLTITDVASVKGAIQDQVPTLPDTHHMVLGHPMAGSNKMGVQHADPKIMAGATYVLVPSTSDVYNVFRSFIEGLGFSVLQMAADDHDRAVGYASHLPYFMSTLTADLVGSLDPKLQETVLPVCASGFRDSTRIAGSDPNWGADIAFTNSQVLLEGLGHVEARINALKTAIRSNDTDTISQYLSNVKSFLTQNTIQK